MFNITPVNDAPVIGTNNGLTVNEDESGTISSSKLNEADPDDSGAGMCLHGDVRRVARHVETWQQCNRLGQHVYTDRHQ